MKLAGFAALFSGAHVGPVPGQLLLHRVERLLGCVQVLRRWRYWPSGSSTHAQSPWTGGVRESRALARHPGSAAVATGGLVAVAQAWLHRAVHLGSDVLSMPALLRQACRPQCPWLRQWDAGPSAGRSAGLTAQGGASVAVTGLVCQPWCGQHAGFWLL